MKERMNDIVQQVAWIFQGNYKNKGREKNMNIPSMQVGLMLGVEDGEREAEKVISINASRKRG